MSCANQPGGKPGQILGKRVAGSRQNKDNPAVVNRFIFAHADSASIKPECREMEKAKHQFELPQRPPGPPLLPIAV
jgi:hypothetical protein